MNLEFSELAAYTLKEREKWRRWFDTNPSALETAVQPGARFPAVWDLLDHVFLIEARHTLRIRREQVVDQTGAVRGDLGALWAFADASRARFIETVQGIVETGVREFGVRDQVFRMTPRKLVFHILLHEIRHFAQIAVAVRNAGFPPPGDHDLFFSRSIE